MQQCYSIKLHLMNSGLSNVFNCLDSNADPVSYFLLVFLLEALGESKASSVFVPQLMQHLSSVKH